MTIEQIKKLIDDAISDQLVYYDVIAGEVAEEALNICALSDLRAQLSRILGAVDALNDLKERLNNDNEN